MISNPAANKVRLTVIAFLLGFFLCLTPYVLKTGAVLTSVLADCDGKSETVYSQSGAHVETDASISADQRILPVIMYHQVLKSAKNKYTVTPAAFERDLTELKKRGYQTVFPSEVIRFAESGGDFPQKPIIITFDDGHYNNLFYCNDILKKHGCKALVNVVGRYCENCSGGKGDSNPMYSYLTWAQIRDMAASGVFEIGNHTYDMHSLGPRYGIARKKNESEGDYRKAVSCDISKLQDKLKKDCGVTPQCFAYPFGRYNKLSKQILSDCGFKLLFTCTENRSVITAKNPDCLLGLCRFNRNPKLTSEAFFNKIEKSKLKW